VRGLPTFSDPNLLIGPDAFSDAGVYLVAKDTAIVQTLDFFPPIVDDPYVFGQIAAANALGDVYAMGARPITAMNVVGFPEGEADEWLLGEIMRGGAERVAAAGAVIVGGHSVRDREIKYGLSVTGVVDPAKMLSNAGARAGDALVLTKPLGTGFITTANRAERCPAHALKAACETMMTLNDVAARCALEHGASASTDVTGFGLAGHALEVAKASDVTIEIDVESLPLIDGALELATSANFSQANTTNRAHIDPDLAFDGGAEATLVEFVFDPQTSGGLLISIAADRAEALVEACRAGGLGQAAIIGRVKAAGEHRLIARA